MSPVAWAATMCALLHAAVAVAHQHSSWWTLHNVIYFNYYNILHSVSKKLA